MLPRILSRGSGSRKKYLIVLIGIGTLLLYYSLITTNQYGWSVKVYRDEFANTWYPRIPDPCNSLTQRRDCGSNLKFTKVEQKSLLLHNSDDQVRMSIMKIPIIRVSPKSLYIRVFGQTWTPECGLPMDVPISPFNYSIGLGINKMTFKLDPPPSIKVELNETIDIKLTVIRELPLPTREIWEMKTCVMKQNCLFLLNNNEPCGLMEMDSMLLDNLVRNGFKQASEEWKDFVEFTNTVCSFGTQNYSDNQDPIWYVPCENCLEESSCNWHKARWFGFQPVTRCLYDKQSVYRDRLELIDYLKQRELIFIGDSTLRGPAYAFYERFNGSLESAPKTHKQITLKHSSQASTHFMYHIEYGNASENGDEKMAKLLDRVAKIQTNASQAIIVIGGVKWLRQKTMDDINNFVTDCTSDQKRCPFESVRVIVKDYSAGFYLPINGVPYFDQESKHVA